MVKIVEKAKIIKRIQENEEKLDKLCVIVNELDVALNKFEEAQTILKELNEYYGSKEWFEDKEAFDGGNIKNVKAGVLSEDAVWDLITDINYLKDKMKKISDKKK